MTKNIILCSDGTGDKGGNGNESNVYKLYQAVDIHNKETQQVSFYDNGVGTKEDGSAVKSNKIWVTLSGALGLGFKDNVRDLYEYLARHYQAGDKIFIFGFSRGAATVRAFTGFINCCGLLDKSKTATEAEFQTQINNALQAYVEIKSKPELASDFKEEFAITGKDYAPDANLQIHFLAVWDTVSALGFPDGTWKTSDWFFKITDKLFYTLEKMTDKKWPHQFYDYELNDNILNAYQALAIDDERKTFCPKIWDENKRKPDSVEQVWFAGAHANIGGGYPRSGLSNITLQWLINQASEKGLVFIEHEVTTIEAHANAEDKLYDSRDGFAIYYRYEPRNIEKLCIDQQTGQAKIEAGKIKIHNTVTERVKQETALYAPGFLPAEFEIVETGSKKKKKVSFDIKKHHDNRQELHKLVDKRQSLYRTFVEITFFMLVSALFLWSVPPESVKDFILQESTQNLAACQALQNTLEQCFTNTVSLFPPQRWIYELLTYVFPAVFKNFIIYVVCIHPIIFIIMMVTITCIYKIRIKYIIKQSLTLAKIRLLLLETFKSH